MKLVESGVLRALSTRWLVERFNPRDRADLDFGTMATVRGWCAKDLEDLVEDLGADGGDFCRTADGKSAEWWREEAGRQEARAKKQEARLAAFGLPK